MTKSAIRKAMLATSAMVHAPQTDTGTAKGGNKPAKAMPPITAMTARKGNVNAISMADTFAENDEAMQDVQLYVNSVEETALGEINVYFDLVNVLGDETLAATPIPGTKLKNADGSDNPFADEYKADKADGSDAKVSRYWSRDFADNLPLGKEYLAELAKATELAKSDKVTAAKDRNKWKARQNSLYRVIQGAFGLFHQIKAMENYPGATFDWVYASDGTTMERTNKPIRIRSALNRDSYVDKTARQFLGFDIEGAKAKGGTYQNLLDSSGQGADNANGNKSRIKSVEAFGAVLADVLNYCEDDDNYNTLKRALKKEGPEQDKLLLSIQEMVDQFIAAIASVPNGEKRVKELRVMQASAGNIRKAS